MFFLGCYCISDVLGKLLNGYQDLSKKEIIQSFMALKKLKLTTSFINLWCLA